MMRKLQSEQKNAIRHYSGLEGNSEKIEIFRKVFAKHAGTTTSTIHGETRAEYDAVIAYGSLDAMILQYNDGDQAGAAIKFFSLARKNHHLSIRTWQPSRTSA